MFRLFLLTSWRFAGLAACSLLPHPQLDAGSVTGWGLRRRLITLAFLPVLGLAIGLHWLGFLLDEIFFRGYRRVAIRAPLFVLGVPRSGTTNLHQVLARDAQFTTFRTWESLFALSVSARKFWLALAGVDRRLGGHLARLMAWLESRAFASMDDVHPMTLDSPEEDYFALLPLLSCFILVLPFPFARHLWDIGQFDRRVPAWERAAILDFYHSCLQRHLYVHGPEKRLLSKNAAFAPLAGSLLRRFPDARFLVCLREPQRTLPSQLSSIGPGLAFFGTPPDNAWIRDQFIDQLRFYYLNLASQLGGLPPERCVWLSIQDLRKDLRAALAQAYRQLGLPLSEAFDSLLITAAEDSRRYRSSHQYQLADFGLDAGQITQAFAAVHAEPRLAATLHLLFADRAPPQPEPSATASLRVAILSDAAPERNGVGAYYRDLAEHLRGAGVQVRIVSPRYRHGRWHGGLAVPLPGDRTQRFMLPSPWLIQRRFERIRPNVVIIPTPGPYAMLGLLFAKRHRARIIVGFHTHFERLAAMNQDWSARAPIAQWYLNSCNRKLFAESALVLANSPDMVGIARAIGARHVGLMGTSIPRRFIEQPLQPLQGALKQVLFAGRLAPEKNLQAVVDAAHALPDIRFLIAGEGPLRAWLEEQARKLPNLDYLGWVHRRRILTLIDSVDALVLPSTVESFGTIALEAMARARLVVVSAQCGILSWDQLNQGLFQIAEQETLADVLRRIAALDPESRQRKAATARAAATAINALNLQHWLEILRDGRLTGLPEAASSTDAQDQAR